MAVERSSYLIRLRGFAADYPTLTSCQTVNISFQDTCGEARSRVSSNSKGIEHLDFFKVGQYTYLPVCVRVVFQVNGLELPVPVYWVNFDRSAYHCRII